MRSPFRAIKDTLNPPYIEGRRRAGLIAGVALTAALAPPGAMWVAKQIFDGQTLQDGRTQEEIRGLRMALHDSVLDYVLAGNMDAQPTFPAEFRTEQTTFGDIDRSVQILGNALREGHINNHAQPGDPVYTVAIMATAAAAGAFRTLNAEQQTELRGYAQKMHDLVDGVGKEITDARIGAYRVTRVALNGLRDPSQPDDGASTPVTVLTLPPAGAAA